MTPTPKNQDLSEITVSLSVPAVSAPTLAHSLKPNNKRPPTLFDIHPKELVLKSLFEPQSQTVNFFSRLHLYAEVYKLLEKDTNMTSGSKHEWPHAGTVSGSPFGSQPPRKYLHVLRVVQPKSRFPEFAETPFGPAILTFPLPADMATFEKHLGSPDRTEPRVLQLFSVSSDAYRTVRPAMRGWAYSRVVPRSVSVSGELYAFHPHICAPKRTLQLGLTILSGMTKSALREKLIKDSENVEKMLNDMEMEEKRRDKTAEKVIENAERMDVGLALSRRLLRAGEVREDVKERWEVFDEGKDKSFVDKTWDRLEELERAEKKFLWIFDGFAVIYRRCAFEFSSIKNYIFGNINVRLFFAVFLFFFVTFWRFFKKPLKTKSLEELYKSIAREIIIIEKYAYSNFGECPSDDKYKLNSFLVYLKCVIFAMMGYRNDSGLIPELTLTHEITFIYGFFSQETHLKLI